MADKTIKFNVIARDENTRRTLNQIADAADEAGDQFQDMGHAAKRADNDIEGLEREILKLKVAMAGVDGDAFADMDKQLRGLERTLSRKVNVRKAFADAGDDGASAFGARFSQRIGPVLLHAPISPPLIGAAAAAAPVVASLLGAAVSGGVALGVVGIGAAIAAQDDAVQAAGARLGKTLSAGLKEDSKAFVEPLLGAIDRAEAKFNELRPTIREIFDVGAVNADNLFSGLIEGSDEVVRDFKDINKNATPVVNVLGRDIPAAAAAASGALKQLSADAEFNAKTLDVAFKGLETLIGGSGVILKGLQLAGKYSILGAAIDMVGDSAEESTPPVEGFTGWTGKADTSATGAAASVRSLSEAMRDSAEANANAFNSATNLGEAMDNMTASLKENGKTHSTNSEQGRANRQALDELAGAIRTNVENLKTLKGSQGEATAAMGRGYTAFVKAAVGAGYTTAQARALAVQLGLIPPAKSTKTTVEAAEAIRRARQLRNEIDGIHGKTVFINVETGKGFGGFHGFSHGGIVAGRGSGDTVPAMLTPGEGVLTRSGMQRIGGKAGLDAINRGGGYGGASSAGAGANVTINVTVPPNAGRTDQQLVRDIAAEVSRVIAKTDNIYGRAGG
jgi:hypothetical protein